MKVYYLPNSGEAFKLTEYVLFIQCSTISIITPRAHARARGYVIGRGVYYIYIIIYCYISAKLFSIFQNTHFQRSILTQIGFSSNLMASGTA